MGANDMKTVAYIIDGRLEHVGEWDLQIGEFENPIPRNAERVEIDSSDIVLTEKGRMVLQSDWYSLREDAYPDIRDQLDAAWKGGEDAEAMRQLIISIKEKYPKPTTV